MAQIYACASKWQFSEKWPFKEEAWATQQAPCLRWHYRQHQHQQQTGTAAEAVAKV